LTASPYTAMQMSTDCAYCCDDRHIDRQTDRQTEKQTDRQRDRQTETDRQRNRHTRQTGEVVYAYMEGQKLRTHTCTQTNIQIGRQAGRQADSSIEGTDCSEKVAMNSPFREGGNELFDLSDSLQQIGHESGSGSQAAVG